MRLRLQRFYKVEADSPEQARERVKQQFDKETELNETTVKEVSEIVSEKVSEKESN